MNPETTAPVLQGEIDLKTYEIQGSVLKQRAPCFDYQLNIIKRKFDERYHSFMKAQMRSTAKELLSDEELKKVFLHIKIKDTTEYFTIVDRLNVLDAKVKDAQAKQDVFAAEQLMPELQEVNRKLDKLNALRNDHPELYLKFQSFLNDIITDSSFAHELFIMDRNNLYELCCIMLEGKVSIVQDVYSPSGRKFIIAVGDSEIDLNPFADENKNIELDTVGLTMLYGYLAVKKK